MPIEKFLGQLVDIALQITTGARPSTAPSAPTRSTDGRASIPSPSPAKTPREVEAHVNVQTPVSDAQDTLVDVVVAHDGFERRAHLPDAPVPDVPVEPITQAPEAVTQTPEAAFVARNEQDEPEEDDALAGPDEVRVMPAGRAAVLVSWQISEARLDRARTLAGADATLEARLYVIVAGGSEGPSTQLRRRPVGRNGEWLAADLSADALVTASIGLTNAAQFTSIVHASSIDVA